MTHQQDEDTPCPNCGLSKADFQKQGEQIKELTNQVEELKKRLLRYENANVPPSKNSLMYREMKRERMEERRKREEESNGSSDNGSLMAMPPKKVGRKNGHVGVTQVFEPTGRPIVHTMDKCPNCDSTRLSVT
jgi:hypothetical protein